MTRKITNLELSELAYIQGKKASLTATEELLTKLAGETYPEGQTVVETDAGPILVNVHLEEAPGMYTVTAEYVE